MKKNWNTLLVALKLMNKKDKYSLILATSIFIFFSCSSIFQIQNTYLLSNKILDVNSFASLLCAGGAGGYIYGIINKYISKSKQKNH